MSVRGKPLLYLAAPLFNEGERSHNLKISAALEIGFDVYLPQIDGALLPALIASGLSAQEAKKQIFQNDLTAIQRCDVLLIVMNGRAIDEGAAFELGVAWTLNKPCFGFKDDFRQLVCDGDNPMIEGALINTFTGLEELKAWATACSVNPTGFW
ncbi:nucleoside 2-deoxyribosyltransferase [Paramagnetospirillum magneticum]|uniref:nucleoside 2-deoxyribosyltransferase n=1 Tax=Paramagnetospirillum magneticum TaxID=84159 RepID=UPI0005C133DD|nr:nucleoside 2-deoxyribosyltransferase [Paramagnetospirillum magneticum]